ncbi:ShlB/FhaC/HecB family hemolysin secretion/activation protein [Kosakonia sp. ML.JS2a]|uniref:ShlB/FhaC/HecB family hemolysin secretion/activation protein n=1 Tax=Kosakonia sp. ML.JS2a TaxID=2980557 RepID=UPI0021DA30A4|nr:ShlB/FhaC/HecB family hemolysin secretion/activation protein [Kosakonia sp. ML.JS2a]UXY10991.1 ShlB/FhaC/HecB family hemolysin secretion/activation protein [Kosakonia sp. ML.JS2a]
MDGRVRYLVLFLLFAATAQAAPLSPADRDAVRQQQEQLLLQNQQQRDELERSTPLPRAGQSVPASQPGGPCFAIHTITLSGVTLISAKAQQKLTAPWQNRCLDMAKITELTAAISDWYISRGYITSRAFLTEQDLSQGELRLVVLEGKLRHIRLDGDSPRMLKMVFPGLEGKVLNLRDIEQGMEQINRLRSNPVQIEIIPDSEPGYSSVNLTATPEFPLSASVSLDNSGQKSTGENQLNGSLGGNNLLGVADKWFVSGGRSSDFATGYDAQSFQAGVSVPWGYSLLDYSYAWSNYRTTLINMGYPWISTGDTKTHRLNLSRVVFRNGDIKTALSAGITQRSSRNWLNDAPLTSSTRNLSSLQLGVSHTQKILGGVATFNPAYSHGTPWFNAETDEDKTGDVPRAQFRKWSLSASFQRPVTRDLLWLTSLYGQWSPDRLYGSERLTLGGESSVRGFKEQYISGDNGGYWRNELNYALFTLPVLGQISATVALDGGWLEKDRLDRYASGTVWGASAGLGSAGRWFASQLSAGTPLHYPDWLGPDHVSINWRVAVTF